jgi:hypothetical protein
MLACISIKAYLKEKMGYSKFYYNPEITKIHNNADARVEKPFSSSLVDYKSKGCVQVDSNKSVCINIPLKFSK